MDNYRIKFDDKNSNAIHIYENNKLMHMIACPSIEKGCDIIDFSRSINKKYTHNFDGLILITTKNDRKLYYKGDLIAETKRKIRKGDLIKCLGIGYPHWKDQEFYCDLSFNDGTIGIMKAVRVSEKDFIRI